MDGQMHSPAGLTLHDGVKLQAPGLREATASGAGRAILFLDDLRLTRDCLTEAIQEHCPEMQVIGLRTMDYQRQTISSSIAIIIFNLHTAPIPKAVATLRSNGAGAAPPVLLITSGHERNEGPQAVECGVAGLVRADARIELLIAAIRLVIAGGRYFPADMLAPLMAKAPRARQSL
jgi:DNA-binding NarL/FixJ family response regulator